MQEENRFGFVAFNPRFLERLGFFHASWSSSEMLSAYAIGHFLKITHEQALILTSGMEFGRKAMLARNLAKTSTHPNRAEIINLFGKLVNESKRNAFAHGILMSSGSEIIFLEQSRGGDYKVKAHKFTLKSFNDHVSQVIQLGTKLHDALGFDAEDYAAFGQAALRAAKD